MRRSQHGRFCLFFDVNLKKLIMQIMTIKNYAKCKSWQSKLQQKNKGHNKYTKKVNPKKEFFK